MDSRGELIQASMRAVVGIIRRRRQRQATLQRWILKEHDQLCRCWGEAGDSEVSNLSTEMDGMPLTKIRNSIEGVGFKSRKEEVDESKINFVSTF